MPTDAFTDPGTRLLLDEAELDAEGTARLLVIDEPVLARALFHDEQLRDDQAHHDQAPDKNVHALQAFCDRADLHQSLPAAIRVDPSTPVCADIALVRIPTSLDQLDEYAGWAHASGVQRVVAVGREKDLARRMNDVLGRWFTDVRGSRGRDKHRVLHAWGPREKPAVPPEARWPRRVRRDGLTIVAHGGTFGTTKLDPGTRLLLGHLGAIRAFAAASPHPPRMLDIGSGNGTISAELARTVPEGHLTAVDVSWAGAAATRATLAANVSPTGSETPSAASSVVWGDALDLLRDADPFDLIVTNPPFHLGVAKDSTFTRDLLKLAPRRLNPGGQLWVVHNTHLPWLPLLRERHPDAERVAQDRQFSVIRLTNSRTPTDRPMADAGRVPRLAS